MYSEAHFVAINRTDIEKVYKNTVMILSFRTDRSWHTVHNQIRLLMIKPPCSNFRAITATFSGVRIFRSFMVIREMPWRVIHINEPHHEKTCLRGFQPGKTNRPAQIQRLASLEISAIASGGIILSRQRTTTALIKLHRCAV